MRKKYETKTNDQIRKMRIAGLLTAKALENVKAAIRPGVTTLELDQIAEQTIRAGGGRPNLTVFADPYSGKITGQFNRRKSLFNTVEMLHRFLLAGKNSIGNTIVGLSTFFFLFILITGVVLWWPKNKKIMRQRSQKDGTKPRQVDDGSGVVGF